MAGLIVGGMVTINRLTAPRPSQSAVRGEAFECGDPPSGSARSRFSVRFYLTALLFFVFDGEMIFLYPWAVELRKLGMFRLVEALIDYKRRHAPRSFISVPVRHGGFNLVLDLQRHMKSGVVSLASGADVR